MERLWKWSSCLEALCHHRRRLQELWIRQNRYPVADLNRSAVSIVRPVAQRLAECRSRSEDLDRSRSECSVGRQSSLSNQQAPASWQRRQQYWHREVRCNLPQVTTSRGNEPSVR